MTRFSESWLREYQVRGAAMRGAEARLPSVDRIAFTLPRPMVLLNQVLRMEPWDRRRYQRELSDEIGRITAAMPHAGPFDRARVTITRYASGKAPDYDGVVGGMKFAQDILCVRSATHPTGLGFIVDDNPGCLVPVYKSAKCRRTDQRTEFLIERLP